RYISYWGFAYVPSMTLLPHLVQDRPGRSGDQIPFLDRGIPAVRFIETKENPATQHNTQDTVENMTPAYTARIAQVIVATAGSLARGPSAPSLMAVSGNAAAPIQLSWAPPSVGAVDHFVVAARPVTEVTYRRRVVIPASLTTVQSSPTELGVDGAG